MNARADLDTRRDILLIGLQARRLGYARRPVVVIAATPDPVCPRSAVLRFILRQPHLCLWAVSEALPLLSGSRKRGTLQRFAQAWYADLYAMETPS